MILPNHVRDSIERLVRDYAAETCSAKATLEGVGEVDRYLSGYARLLKGDGGLSGDGDIRIETYDKGKYPHAGFWAPIERILGIQNPDSSMDPEESRRNLESVVVHEVGHIRYSDPNIISDTPELQTDTSLMTLLNIFEDPRVERLITGEYPGTLESIRLLRASCVESVNKPIVDNESNPFSVVHGIASEIAVSGKLRDEEFYLKFIRNEFSKPGMAENFVQDVVDASRKTLVSSSTGECLEIAREIRDKYFPRAKDNSKSSGEGRGKRGHKKFSTKSTKMDADRIGKSMIGASLSDFANQEEGSASESAIPKDLYNREHKPLGNEDWRPMIGVTTRNLISATWTQRHKFGQMKLSSEIPQLDRSGRLDTRQLFRSHASGRFSRDVFRSEEISNDPVFYLMLIMDCSGSMKLGPTDEGCKIAYSLAKKQSYDPAFRVRIIMCNSRCPHPLLLKDYDLPLTDSGFYVLRTFFTNGSGEGLITSDPYFRFPRKPDMALFLTDGMVDCRDVEWLRSIRQSFPIRAAYVGGSATDVEEGFRETFGENAYIVKKNAEELGLHLDRLLNTFVRGRG